MRRIALFAIAAGFVVPLMATAPAHAQATRTWVSGVGDDVNPCSRTAPCKTFAGAISKTSAGGEINCLDPGGFGGVTITKSLTISCEGVTAGVLVSSVNGVVIAAGAADVVMLKGLDIEGLGMSPQPTGLNGIKVTSAAAVQIEDCVIRNFRAASPNGFGIQIAPSTTLTFTVARTTVFNNGTGATGGGIQVRPTAGATTGTLDRVIANRNVFGIAGDGNGGGSAVNVSVQDSTLNGNVLAGVIAATGAVGVGVIVTRSTVSNNSTAFQASGAGANVRVGFSQASGNSSATSGTIFSFTPASNAVVGNGNDGTFTPIAFK
jgi:hypothetical protein